MTAQGAINRRTLASNTLCAASASAWRDRARIDTGPSARRSSSSSQSLRISARSFGRLRASATSRNENRSSSSGADSTDIKHAPAVARPGRAAEQASRHINSGFHATARRTFDAQGEFSAVAL